MFHYTHYNKEINMRSLDKQTRERAKDYILDLTESRFNQLYNLDLLVYDFNAYQKHPEIQRVAIMVQSFTGNSKASERFRYEVIMKSKEDIRYRYFLRLIFKACYDIRHVSERNERYMNCIFKRYDSHFEGYRDMKIMMLEVKLGNRK